MQEFYYRSAHPAQGQFPGHHRSHLGDSGQEFRSHRPLFQASDARRLDLLASARDPLGQWWVRLASERKAIPVYAVADLSASMGCGEFARRIDVLADFTESLAWSAWRTGDPFGFIGCDEHVRLEWVQPLGRSRGAGFDLAGRLRRCVPGGRSAAGLAEAHRMLQRQRALVFLLSDFHLPLDTLERVLDSLAAHDVVPVMLGGGHELALPPKRFGLVTVRDAESGRQRLLWLRPALHARWNAHVAARQEALEALFRRHRLQPLRMPAGFDAETVTAYFHR